MARSAPAGESKAPLVVALAFFVLATLALGVMTYLFSSDKAAMAAALKDAESKKADAEKLRKQDQEQKLLYKVALGIATPEERESLQNATSTAEVKAAYTDLMAGIRNTVAGTVKVANRDFVGQSQPFNVPPEDVFKWDYPEGGKLAAAPTKSLLDSLVSAYAAKQRAQIDQSKDKAQYDQAVANLGTTEAQLKAAIVNFKAAADKFPTDVDGVKKKYADDLKAAADQFVAATAAYTKAERDNEEKRNADALKIKQRDDKLAAQGELVNKLESQVSAKDDPFSYDAPHGKITTRSSTNLVEINLGSADNLREGTTFSVQPSNTPQVGIQSRVRMERGPDGKTYPRVVPKGTIEVVQILGPKLSTARITTEGNSVREGILPGDLLYNSAWRPGSADHVALFGVFDIEGDGIDDMKNLVRDLSKSGIVVDAYYDLSKLQWVGNLTPRTIYGIEGYIPDIRPGEGLADAKGKLIEGLTKAREDVKNKGAKVVKMRDFFPRIGYRIRLDVSDAQISQAVSPFLQTAAPPAEGETPTPTGKN